MQNTEASQLHKSIRTRGTGLGTHRHDDVPANVLANNRGVTAPPEHSHKGLTAKASPTKCWCACHKGVGEPPQRHISTGVCAHRFPQDTHRHDDVSTLISEGIRGYVREFMTQLEGHKGGNQEEKQKHLGVTAPQEHSHKGYRARYTST